MTQSCHKMNLEIIKIVCSKVSFALLPELEALSCVHVMFARLFDNHG